MVKEKGLVFLIAAALLFFLIVVVSEAAPVPDTGQTKCYDTAGTEITCDGSGQDGEYNINPMSFTDNGNGTVTDNVTGLLWQKEDDTATKTWADAGTYCDSLTLGGQSGWRLPSKQELMSVFEYTNMNVQTYSTTYFTNIKHLDYWSSITLANDTNFAWTMSLADGSIAADLKTDSNKYVRCVRGAQTSLSVNDNGNGTVTDNVTGLMWQQGDQGAMAWANALSSCKSLSLGGQADWRLPNIKELVSLTDDTKFNPAIDTTYFPNTSTNSYWSSTTYTDNRDAAEVVNYAQGKAISGSSFLTPSVSGGAKSNGSTYVRCVRGGQQNYCAATVSASLVVHIPIITFSGASYWAGLQYNSASSNLTIANAGVVSDVSPYSSCTASILSADFRLHISILMLNNVSYWADLQFNGSVFTITDFGAN